MRLSWWLAPLLLLWCVISTAAPLLSLTLREANVADVIRILGQYTHRNLVVSAGVTGTVSLQFEQATVADALALLFTTQGLAEWRQGDVVYVAPRTELLTRLQEEAKWQEATDAVTPLHTQTWHLHYAKADDIAHILQDASTSMLSHVGHVRVDARTNTLFIQELPKYLPAVRQVIQQLDVPVHQVMIEARLASVDHDAEQALGVRFTTQGLGGDNETHAGFAQTFSLAVAKLANGSILDVALAAMEAAGKGELISAPSLFTANQQPAVIESGEEIPYQEISPSGGTTIAFKKAVLSLHVTPQVLPGGKLLLQLQVNQDRPSNRMVLGVPAISTRQIRTQVLVKNGQTLVLGGIYELNKEHDVLRVPFLSEIPLVGLLFQQQNAKETKRELLIFVTPKIIA